MSAFLYEVYQARLQERVLNCDALLSNLTCLLKAKPGKLCVKRGHPVILFISILIISLFKLAIMP